MDVANLLATKGRPVITIRPMQPLHEAVAALAEHGIGALVVVDDARRPIGIVTERHIVRRLAADAAILDRAVGDVMTTNLVTATRWRHRRRAWHASRGPLRRSTRKLAV